jgi:peptide/nickel transport system substrate-binding protein
MAVGLILAGCTPSTPPEKTDTSQIVIDTSFDIKTIDPGRQYEPTGMIVDKALYDTLLTFADGDTANVIPSLASYVPNDDLTEFILTMEEGRLFSDGTPVTAADAVFTLERLAGMKGNPSFLLDGVTIELVDEMTLKLSTEDPNPALPAILATPSAGILNSAVVIANGGTTGVDDGADAYLNANSAGSGPYMLVSMDLATEVVFVKNPYYNGAQTPTYDKVILRNVDPATQKMSIERGDSQVALGLSSDQVESLSSSVKVKSVSSATLVFLLMNADPAVNELTANPQCVKAVKEAIDYQSLLDLAGLGAAQATGVIPNGFLGALPAADQLKFDLEAAKADATACGMNDVSITLSLPNDIDPTGLNMTNLAQRLQQQLAAAGITVTLAPAPFATEIDAYRTGKEHIGLWYWNPDYQDPAGYLVFSPGQMVGLRANWQAGANPVIEGLVPQATTASDPVVRAGLLEDWGRAMIAEGPFIPLIQPGSNVAYQPTVTNIHYSPTWIINVAGLGAA